MRQVRAVIESMSQDAGYAIRGLRRSPGLSLTILMTFALGFGANAALFSVVDRLFFQAPPGVADPGSVRRLVEHSRSYDGSEYMGAAFTTRDHGELTKIAIGDVEGYDLETRVDIGDGKYNGVVAYATAGFFRLTGVHGDRACDGGRAREPRARLGRGTRGPDCRATFGVTKPKTNAAWLARTYVAPSRNDWPRRSVTRPVKTISVKR